MLTNTTAAVTVRPNMIAWSLSVEAAPPGTIMENMYHLLVLTPVTLYHFTTALTQNLMLRDNIGSYN